MSEGWQRTIYLGTSTFEVGPVIVMRVCTTADESAFEAGFRGVVGGHVWRGIQPSHLHGTWQWVRVRVEIMGLVIIRTG
eukprot:COSAG01_NODE_310_length_19129_cov_22.110615_15_plen_79_part_00